MARSKCGWCGLHANMPQVGEAVEQLLDDEVWEYRVTASHKCDACGALSLAYAVVLDDEMQGALAQPSFSASGRHRYAVSKDMLSWYPPPSTAAAEYKHVPREIASAADEARKCVAFGALRGAVQLARSVVEATAKDKGVTVSGISKKIEEMFKQGLIREYVREGADEVRHFGNEMAHGDFVAPVLAEDARLTLTLMDELLVEVYEGPGRVVEAKNNRKARGGGQA